MKSDWKWMLGILLILILLMAQPLFWQFTLLNSGYGEMMRGYGMPMMRYSYRLMPYHGFMPFGMFLMWLLPLGTLVLIVLGIAWLVKQLTSKPS